MLVKEKGTSDKPKVIISLDGSIFLYFNIVSKYLEITLFISNKVPTISGRGGGGGAGDAIWCGIKFDWSMRFWDYVRLTSVVVLITYMLLAYKTKNAFDQ